MAQHTELYDILEIAPNSDADAIKKAYRKLAVKYHPDKNPGDKSAEEKFKKVAHAYEILSNPEKRKLYDQFGEDALNGGGQGGGFSGNPFDIFEQFFGGGGGGGFSDFFGGGRPRNPNAPMRGNDLGYNVAITLEEAFSGVTRKLDFDRHDACSECHGTGCAKDTHTEPCKRCGGRGQVGVSHGFFTMMQDCPSCRGKGVTIPHPCPKCKGNGVVNVHRSIQVKIPAGVSTDNRMRVAGEGEAGRNGGPNGDLIVVIQVKDHAEFERENNDIYSEIHIPFPIAALGGTVQINTIQGKADLNVPAGTQSGDMQTIRGKGMPVLNHPGSWGSHHVRIVVDVPRKLNDAQKEALRSYAALFETAEAKPTADNGKKGFFDNFKFK